MTGHATFLLGDVHEQVATLPDASVDLIVSSPPFLALRSYLPADHPDKSKEIGSEPNPAEYLDTLLALVAALDRVLAPHGSLVFELGDTYAGSGGAGGDYGEDGLRAGQPAFRQQRFTETGGYGGGANRSGTDRYPGGFTGRRSSGGSGGSGWPLDKSLTGIPTLFAWSLAYGRNLLTGEPSPAGQRRIRNVIPWCRPNPPVGALGDKWRPATSYVTVACRARDRWFDLDAVRANGPNPNTHARTAKGVDVRPNDCKTSPDGNRDTLAIQHHSEQGAPPLDWYLDTDPWVDPTATHQPDDGMWVIPTAPYKGAHYATWPPELVRRIVECMCPREVCRVCQKPRRRIVSEPEYVPSAHNTGNGNHKPDPTIAGKSSALEQYGSVVRSTTTLGWTDCGHGDFRRGLVLDPFCGSATTLAVAVRHGRDAIGIDLDERNIALARQRMGNLPLEAPAVAAEWDEGSLFASPAAEIEDVAL